MFLLLFLTVQGCFNDGEDGAVVAEERKHNGGAQVVRNGPSSPLCSDPPVSVLLFFSESFPPLFCSFGFSFFVPSLCSISLPSLSLPFSSSPKFYPPFLFISLPLFISRKRKIPPCSVPSWCRGENGLPYLCRVRWSAVCRAWCPSLLFITLAGYVGVWAVVSFMQVGG